MTIDYDLLKQVKITPLIDTIRLENIDDEEYFSDKYSSYISNSRLGVLKKEGVKAFFNGIPQTYNPSFETGSLIHTICLQGDDYKVVEGVFKPTAKAGLMADALYKPDGTTPTDDEIKAQSYIIGYYKDKLTDSRLNEFRQKAEPYWRDRFLYEKNNPKSDKKRIYTDERNFELLKGCMKSLNENFAIQKLLHPECLVEEPIIKNENTILMDIKMEVPNYEPRIYKLKAKLDNFTIDTENNVLTVNDLKTTSKPASIFDPTYFSYQRELAFYGWLLKMYAKNCLNIEKATLQGNFLVVSTIPEYTTSIVPMTSKLFALGWKEVIYLLRNVAYFNQVKGYDL